MPGLRSCGPDLDCPAGSHGSPSLSSRPIPSGAKAAPQGAGLTAGETPGCRSWSSALEPFSCLRAKAEPDPKPPVPACPPSSPGAAPHLPLAGANSNPSHLPVGFPSLAEGRRFPAVYKRLCRQRTVSSKAHVPSRHRSRGHVAPGWVKIIRHPPSLLRLGKRRATGP